MYSRLAQPETTMEIPSSYRVGRTPLSRVHASGALTLATRDALDTGKPTVVEALDD